MMVKRAAKIGNYSSFIVYCWTSAICYLLSAILHPPSAIRYPLSAIRHLLSAIC